MTSGRIQKLVSQLLDIHDVCELFGRTSMTVHLWRRSRGMPAIIIRGRGRDSVRFHRSDVMRWAKKEGIRRRKAA